MFAMPYEDDSLTLNANDGDSNVTGISRSGRVRKKSSKLLYYDDDGSKEKTIAKRPRQIASKVPKLKLVRNYDNPDEFATINRDSFSESQLDEVSDTDSSSSSSGSSTSSDSSSSDDGTSNSGTESDEEKENQGIEESLAQPAADISAADLLEDLLPRDEDEVDTVRRKKKGRWDKGVARYSAYMLWSKKTRQSLLDNNPSMESAELTNELNRLWTNIQHAEKYSWKMRAKKMNLLATKRASNQAPSAIAAVGGKRANYINKKELNAGYVQPVTSSEKRKPGRPVRIDKLGMEADKMTVASPMMLAAHFKLLGESLETIGMKLKSHDGEISAGGSLSVLLDATLCAFCPLMSLTRYVPVINAVPVQQLDSLLDDVMYIMPGL